MKLNLGSGSTRLEGYTNIDCDPMVEPDVISRVEDLDYGDNTFEAIYMSHLLEHLRLEDARTLLFNCHKWLHEGCKLFISVPDLGVLAELLVEGVESHIIIEIIYGKPDKPVEKRHQWGYTEISLKRELEVVGFKVLGKFSPLLDSSGYKICGRLVSLNMVGLKG